MAENERIVTIDAETATETATRPEDVARVRREAGVEEGAPPPRGEPSGEDSEVGRSKPRGSDEDGGRDHTLDEAVAVAALDEGQQPRGVPEGAARDDELPPG